MFAYLLKATPVSGESLVKRNSVTACVLPVGHTRRDLPGLLVLHGDLSGRGMHDRYRRRWGTCGECTRVSTAQTSRPCIGQSTLTSRDFPMLEFRGFHRVHLSLHHPNHTLPRVCVEPGSRCVRRVTNESRVLDVALCTLHAQNIQITQNTRAHKAATLNSSNNNSSRHRSSSGGIEVEAAAATEEVEVELEVE